MSKARRETQNRGTIFTLFISLVPMDLDGSSTIAYYDILFTAQKLKKFKTWQDGKVTVGSTLHSHINSGIQDA